MRTTRLKMLLLSACVIGCGPSVSVPDAPPALTQGTHGGIAHRLPGDAGFVEIVNEPEVDRDTTVPTAIVVYFLGPDGTQPMASPPTRVRFDVDSGSRRGPVSLDLADSNRFASAPGPFALDTIRGTLLGEIEGEEFAIEGIGGSQ